MIRELFTRNSDSKIFCKGCRYDSRHDWLCRHSSNINWSTTVTSHSRKHRKEYVNDSRILNKNNDCTNFKKRRFGL